MAAIPAGIGGYPRCAGAGAPPRAGIAAILVQSLGQAAKLPVARISCA